MGMFDHIIYNGNVYQTKDFDCVMTTFYIEGGRLLETVGHTEDKSEATKWKKEHPGEPLPKELEGLSGMCGCMSWVETGRKDLNFHGFLNFYRNPRDTAPYGWEEFNAKFTDGNLVEVVQVPDEHPTP